MTLLRTLLVLGLLASASLAGADTYPSRAIKWVVPFSAGSATDVVARIVARKVAESVGQPVIIENKAGAGGMVGMQSVAQSRPDGYTFVVASSSQVVVAPAVMKSLPFDPLKDFAPVSLISFTPIVLVVAKTSPVNTVNDLVAQSKVTPGSYGNVAPTYELIMELLKFRTKADLVSVGYKGPNEAMSDLLSGRLSVLPSVLGSSNGLLQAGRTKAIAVLGARRLPELPDTPTMSESGFADFEFGGWNGIMAPAGTPTAAVEKMNAEITKALMSDDVRKEFATLLLEPAPNTTQEYGDQLTREYARFAQIVRDAGIEKR